MQLTQDSFTILKSIGDLSGEGMILYSLDERRVLYANEPATRITGLREHAGLHNLESLLDRVAEQDRAYVMQQLETVITRSRCDEFEIRLQSEKDKRFICCHAYLVEQASVMVVYLKDISRAKEHEDYLVEFGAKKNALLDTLTHNISGALALMQTLTSEAEKYIEGSNPKKLKRYLTLVSENSQMCLKIINDFLQYEHDKSPHISIRTSRVDLVEKIGFIRQELQHTYAGRIIHLFSPVKYIHVTTDEVKLLQVINNLVANAVKFSEPSQPIAIHLADYAKEVMITVVDQGIGIPDKLKPMIFTRESNAGRTGLKGEKSRGVGLSICKNLVELLGGRIWFESEEGKGSVFYISLPKN
jgi:two-component system sensor histidine kinase VicK